MNDAAAGPFFFGLRNRRAFGWLHPATEPAGDVGVVLCNPFGFEAMATHRSYRHFAEAFARAGFPALRFDYDGTGDSAGSDRDPGRVRAWVDSIHRAIDVLEERTGVRRVCLFGVRLGATLAATAASERADCAGVIAIVPVVSPEHYLRELQALQAWGRAQKSPDGTTGLGEGDQEASGFVITAATSAALMPLDLTKLAKPPAPRVLLIERADRQATGAWAKRLGALGVEVDARRIGGFIEMNLDPHKAIVPHAMITASVEWLLDTRRRTAESLAALPAPASPVPYGLDSEVDPGVEEVPVFIDANRSLFGIVTHPTNKARSGRAILLLNAGAQHRIGPNRLWVDLARHWAKMGLVVLRLDISGLGDSPARAGEKENEVYTPSGAKDIADALSFLRREWGASHSEIVGLCGSAYQVLKAGARGVGIDRIVAINPQVFHWDPAAPVAPVATSKAASEAARYRRAAFKAESWKKLLTGKVQLGAARRIFQKRLVDFTMSQGRRVARRLGVPLEQDIASDLSQIAKHGIGLRFVFTDDEAGEQLLMELAGSMVSRLRKKGVLTIDHVHGADHTFTAVWTHRMLQRRMDEWLGLSPKA
jgi:alpha-beta hydrolase superfamily lysophospholipase